MFKKNNSDFPKFNELVVLILYGFYLRRTKFWNCTVNSGKINYGEEAENKGGANFLYFFFLQLYHSEILNIYDKYIETRQYFF